MTISYLNKNCKFHEKCIWHWLTRTSKFLEGAEKLLLKLLIYWKFISFSGTQTSQQTTTNTTNNNVNDRNNNQEVTTPLIWQEFTVPPIWKRLVAEIIDFFFLFLLKLLVTFAAVDMLSIIDLERYDDDFMNFDLFSVKSPFVLFQIRLVIFCRCGNRRHWCFRPSNSIGIYEWFRIFRNDS